MRQCYRVGAEHDFQRRHAQRARIHRVGGGNRGLEWRERGVGEAERVGMVDVVLEDEAELRIKNRSALRHQCELRVRDKDAMLYLRAPRKNRRAHACRTDRMHERAQSE